MRSITILTLIFISAALARAADFSGLESPDFRLLTPDECRVGYEANPFERHPYMDPQGPRPAASGLRNILSWTPDAAPDRIDAPGCSPMDLERTLQQTAASTHAQGDALSSYFQSCEANLHRDIKVAALALLDLEETEYSICDHPDIRPFAIRLGSGEVLRGFLGLKPTMDPRPLVVVRCGAFCDVGDPAQRFLLMHLFDESPFHVLALANSTGADFVRDNGFVAFGGFEEGQQVVRVLQALRGLPLAARVSSVHFVGVSLGSQGGLFASYLEPFNRFSDGAPLMASSFATCPVVDLESSMHSVFSPGPLGWLALGLYDHTVRKVVTTFPSLQSLFPASLSTAQVPDAMADAAVTHYAGLPQGWALAPFGAATIHSRDDLWRQNNFLQLANQAIAVPTLAFAAADDEIVNTNQNTSLLVKLLNTARAADPGFDARSQLAATVIPSGDHCAFNQIYGWRTASALYRGYVISHAPELTTKGRPLTSAIVNPGPVSLTPQLAPSERHTITRFRFQKDLDSILITYQIFNPRAASSCAKETPRSATSDCVHEITANVPFAALSPRPSWAQAPTSDAEAQARTRWANVNLSAVDAQGVPLEGGAREPAGLSWISYEP